MSGPGATTTGAGDPRPHLDALFETALTLEDAARERFVQGIEDEDAALGHELRALLRLAADGSDTLQPRDDGHARWQSMFDASPPAADSPALPGRIGVWQPLRRIGHGGMGTVYLVERNDAGFHQTGALKLLRSGAESDAFLERFARERQILASLTHPGIARLLDGGRSSDGRPYLVMEYVEGETLDRACDRRALDIDARIALFVEIAEAVAHAHRNLIAHRDLKPGNILIGEDGRPKLLDFGIAKALPDASDQALEETGTALRAFTPDYATPEQVLGQPTSTATDLYQLGLLLYELLTGHRAQHARDASQRALEDAVCRSEPPRPSERIGDDDIDRCALRGTTPNALRRRLRGDLDNIVAKALRKAPERRYESANALIDDLARWRTGRPVRARPESWRYRTGKFLRRNAWAVAAGVAIFVLLAGYAITATRQAQVIARERDRAQAEATKARQVQALILRMFEGADPETARGETLTARELLDSGWPLIQSELQGQPDVQIELLDTVGTIYSKLGAHDRAAAMFERSLQAARPLATTQPLLLARALRGVGRSASYRGDYDTAAARLGDALARYRQALGNDDPEVATTLNDLALLQDRRGEYAEAQASFREALAIRRARYGERHLAVAESLHGLGMSLRRLGDYAGAGPLVEQALTLRRQLLPADHPQIAYTISDLAQIRNDLGEFDSAEALYREALASMQKTLGPEHPNVALTMIALSRVLKTRRDFDGARGLLEQALAIRRRTYGAHHPSVGMTLGDLGRLHLDTGDLAGAQTYSLQALAAYRADDPGRETVVYNLGEIAEKRGDLARAERYYRASLAAQRAQNGEDHDRVGARLNKLGGVLYRQGRRDEAERAMRQALAIYRKRLPAEHPRFATVLLPLGTLLVDRGDRNEPAPMLREAWAVRRKAFGERDPRTLEAAQALRRAGLEPD